MLNVNADLNTDVFSNIQTSTITNKGNSAKPSTSTGNNNIIHLADGTNMQVAKFNGKSNITNISKLVTP